MRGRWDLRPPFFCSGFISCGLVSYRPLANLRGFVSVNARADASSAAATRATSGLDALLAVS